MFSFAAIKCGAHEFTCANNQQCIYKKYRCDGTVNCDDGSDERECGE